jgi:flavin-dependent dehydrogenase
MGLDGAVAGEPFRGVRYHGFGLQIESPFPAARGVPAHGLGARRLRLDAALFAAAAATPGVTACDGVRVDDVLVEDGRVRGLLAGGATVRARLVVAADGPRSLVRRRLGLDGRARGPARLGLRAHFRLPADAPACDLVEVFVGEGHEIYVTPLPDREVAVAALTARADDDRRPAELFPRLLALHPALARRLEGAMPSGALGGQLPLESRARRGVAPGVVLLGDAAGFIDPITGGGIAQALLSAELLAAHLCPARGFDPGLDALLEFDRQRRALLRDGAILTRTLLALARRPAFARGTLRLMRRTPSLYRHLVGVAGGTRPLIPG